MTTPDDSSAHEQESVETTSDAVLGGAVHFVQPAAGYRVNQDSILLAAFATGWGVRSRPAELAVDLGAGVGVLGLVLHHLGQAKSLALIEREPSLVRLCRANLERAGVPGQVFEHDLSLGLPKELVNRADVVLTNPPFFAGERHQSENSEARGARHGSLAPFLVAARAALAGSRARAAVAYPARSLDALLEEARLARLTPKRLRFVHPFPGRPARLTLVELRLTKTSGLEVEPPLIEWECPGVRTAELEALIAGQSVR